jgi:putative hydrolase of the HAD superfamily
MPRTDLNPADAVRRLRAEIDREHEEGRRQGRPYPEVDIRRTWASVLRRRSRPVDSRLVDNVALCFELESNPVWPMPDTDDLLRAIAGRMPLGIVSNAQFYTELLFEAILGESLTDLGFDSRLLAFSYVVRRAKPDPALFAGPLAALAEQGIDSSEVTYVGNDMLNDVATARSAGCMTILYAGDTRSLRLRHDDARVQVMPDSVVRSLREIVPLALAREEHR